MRDRGKLLQYTLSLSQCTMHTTKCCHMCVCVCRRRKLDEIKQRKLSELRAAGIPEKYCTEVSRRITAPAPSFTMSQLH